MRTIVLGLATLALCTGSAAAATLTYSNVGADDYFYAYISTDNSVLGTLFAQAGWTTPTPPVSGTVALTPGVINYLHIVSINLPLAAGFGGTFSVDSTELFSNGTTSLTTGSVDAAQWSYAYGGTLPGDTTGIPPQQAWVIPNGIAAEETAAPVAYIWGSDSVSSPGGLGFGSQCTYCYQTFSTAIAPAASGVPEPSTAGLMGFFSIAFAAAYRRRRTKS
jgi:hypothetical protein